MAIEQKHTPGPWSYFYKPKYDEWHISMPMPDSSMKLALCPDGIQSENREADARLIAAAPDMLAALRKIASNDADGHHMFTPQAMQEIARAVVAKATQS